MFSYFTLSHKYCKVKFEYVELIGAELWVHILGVKITSHSDFRATYQNGKNGTLKMLAKMLSYYYCYLKEVTHP